MSNSKRTISPDNTIAVILGASEWPSANQFHASEAFSNSARDIKAYLIGENFGLPIENLLDLFNTDLSQVDIIKKIEEFIVQKKQSLLDKGNDLEDLFLYFVGHGGFAASSNSDYYLAIKSTNRNYENISALPIKSVAKVIKENARNVRHFVILDACFSASAFKEFQSGPQQTADIKSVEAFSFTIKDKPGKGTALLCSSGPRLPSRSLEGEKYTMFSGALLDVLNKGAEGGGEYLSLNDIKELTRGVLKDNYGDEAVLPEAYDPGQEQGNLTDLPLFPNHAKKVQLQSSIISTEDIDFDDGNLYCFIIGCESEAQFSTNQFSLEYIVKQAFKRYSYEIKNVKEVKSIKVIDAISSKKNFDQVIKILCRAQIVVFDVTGFEPAILLLLGIRSVVKRGLTLISVGSNYVLGDFIDLPFNIKEVNLVSHSKKQASEKPHPIDLIGRKIVEGLDELSRLPIYLDLPTYDAIRNLPVDPERRRPKSIDEQILALCPFNNQYQINWKENIEDAIITEIRPHIHKNPTIVRTLDMRSPRLVSQTLYEAIRLTSMCIVDLTFWRPNVLFEFGVRLAVNKIDPIPIFDETQTANGNNHFGLSQLGILINAFEPIKYTCSENQILFPEDAIFKRYESVLANQTTQDKVQNKTFTLGYIYDQIAKHFDWHSDISSIPAYRELAESANKLVGDRSGGRSPVLYPENDDLRVIAEKNALEKRLAAWFYIDNRYTPDEIFNTPSIKKEYENLGNLVTKELIRSPKEKDKELAKIIRFRSKFNHLEK